MSLLSLTGVNKSYQIDKSIEQAVLKGIDLEFKGGEFVSVLGESGCGKSTLMNIIGGMDSDYKGDVFVNGKSLTSMKGKELDDYRKTTVGFIFQNFNLISHLSVLDNVSLAMEMMSMTPAQRHERATQLLTQVGLRDHLHKRPNQLSGGQKQRVSIARALANDPDILLADEPTGALDKETTTQILSLLQEIAEQGKLIIAVTHSSKVASFGTRVITLEDGRVMRDESNEERIFEKQDQSNAVALKPRSLTYLSCAKLALRNMKINWRRNALVSFGSAIGISSLMLMLSIGSGVESYLMDDILSAFNPQMVSISKENLKPDLTSGDPSQMSGMSMLQEITPFEENEIEALRELEHVESVEPVVTYTMKAGLTNLETQTRADLMMLTSIDQTFNSDYLLAGAFPTQNEVMMTSTTASALFETDDYNSILGKTVALTIQESDDQNVPLLVQKELTVSGVYEMDTPMMSGMPMGFLTYEGFEVLYSENDLDLQATQVNLMAESEERVEDLKETLLSMGYSNSQTDQMLEMMMEMLDIMTSLFVGIAGISLVVSGVMILVVLYISVVERTKEIGVLRAIGARRKDIRRIFIVESIGLGLLSGLAAITIAMLIQWGGNSLMSEAFGVGIIDLNLSYVLTGVGVSLIVSTVAGWFPSSKASKLDPVESLRYE